MKREQLYSVSDLKRRGWSKTAVEQFLPKVADDTRDNPHYRNAGAPMKLWKKTRVHRVEKTKGFAAWKERNKVRGPAALSAAATREWNMYEKIMDAEIKIERGRTIKQVYDLVACTHKANYQGDRGEFVWSKESARNSIRHNLTNYETLLAICKGREAGEDAYKLLRKRIDALVEEAYPEFAGSDDGPVPWPPL